MAGSRLVRLAVLAEDAIHVVVVVVVRALGRQPLIIPFVGYGTGEQARIGARVVLGRPAAAAQEVPKTHDSGADVTAADVTGTDVTAADLAGTDVTTADLAGTDAAGADLTGADAAAPARDAPEQAKARTRRRRREVLRASLSRFLTVELPRLPVTVCLPSGAECAVQSDREGYVDTVVELPGLDPGWHDLRLSADGCATEQVKLLVVDPQARIGVVSDVDDTILETGLTRGLAFLKITLLTEVDDRAPLPGAAALYRALVAAPEGHLRPIFYVSTSPWNLHEMLLQFIALRGFPMGPLLLTDWGPGQNSLFRIAAREHKLTLIRRLLAEHEQLDLVLIGDSGQLDPEIYATVAQECPGRIRAIYIRRTPSTGPDRDAQVAALTAQLAACEVPMLAVDDSVQIAEHAASIGLLDRAAVEAVRTETAAD